MLILTRRVGESLKIGDGIDVIILGVKGNQVRVGINAPKDVPVHREEIYRRIQQESNVSGTRDEASGTRDEASGTRDEASGTHDEDDHSSE